MRDVVSEHGLLALWLEACAFQLHILRKAEVLALLHWWGSQAFQVVLGEYPVEG